MNNAELSRYSKRFLQLFWDPIPTNDEDAPIWCLGNKYDSRAAHIIDTSRSIDRRDTDAQIPQTSGKASPSTKEPRHSGTTSEGTEEHRREDILDGSWPTPFLDDFEARVWLTYRSEFPPIAKSQDSKALSAMSFSVRIKSQFNQAGFQSDSGWGCMIRSGQCLVANGLSILTLGRDWRRGQSTLAEQRLLSLFADDPEAPFSIHRFVDHGAHACGKHPGEWFGPSATAQCIQALANEHAESGLRVYINGDGSDVYEDRFFDIAKPAGIFHPTLILVGIRLGIDRVTPVYREALKSSLQMSQSIGIAGGRPSSSHYFVGSQGEHLFYLDPHYTRSSLPFHRNPSEYTDEEVDSCHTRRLHRIHIDEMDPSMLIAFLIRDETDWKEWRKQISSVEGKPIIHVADEEPELYGASVERKDAIDEVEALDDDDELI